MHGLLVQLSELGNEESSPMNDFNYARVIREIIRNDSYYKDNLEKIECFPLLRVWTILHSAPLYINFLCFRRITIRDASFV